MLCGILSEKLLPLSSLICIVVVLVVVPPLVAAATAARDWDTSVLVNAKGREQRKQKA